MLFKKEKASMNDWYNIIKEDTAKSFFIHLSKKEQNMLRFLSYKELVRKRPFMAEIYTEPYCEFNRCEIESMLKTLCSKIDNVLKKEMFFRTDICSPKDVGDCIVSRAEEVIDFYTKSERLFSLLPKIVKNNKLSLVFREVQNFKEEYRVFIKEGQILGISQYYDSCNILRSLKLKDYFYTDETKITKTLNYVHDMIEKYNIKELCLDIGVSENEKFSIIEINPYENSDKCLLAKNKLSTNSFVLAYAISKTEVCIKEYWDNDMKKAIVNLKYEDIEDYWSGNRLFNRKLK